MFSNHPIDWIIHCGLCFLYIYLGNKYLKSKKGIIFLIISCIGIGLLLEWEQKFQIWYFDLSWKQYLIEHSLGDIVADVVGIGLALLIKGIPKWT